MGRRPNRLFSKYVDIVFEHSKEAVAVFTPAVLTPAAYTAGVKAAATAGITTPAKASLVDTDLFTINDGVNPTVTYELDTAGDGAAAGNVAINISGATTAADVAALIKTAIEANQPLISIVDPADGTLNFTYDIPGTIGNSVALTETVGDAGFTVVNPTGGLEPVFTVDSIVDGTLAANDEHSATEQFKLFTVPTGQKFRLDACEVINPTGLAEHADNYWEIEILDDAVVMAGWSTDDAEEGTLAADTPADMTVVAAAQVAAADSVVSLKLTKVASAANLPPGRVRIRGRYL